MNYDLWLGPAPARPFNENHFHYHWHWFWEYGTSDLGNTGVHSLDAVRWLLGKQEHPRTAHSIGGLHEAGAPTDQVTPNTQQATFQYADGTQLHCEIRNWSSGPAEAQGLYIFGSKGWMKVGDDKAQVFFGRRNEAGPDADLRREARRRTGALRELHRLRPVAPVAEPQGDRSRTATSRRRSAISGTFRTGVGRSVTFDGAAERFVGDEEADKLLAPHVSRAVSAPGKT